MFSLLAKYIAPYKWLIGIGAILLIIGSLSFGINKTLKSREQRGYDKAVSEYTKKGMEAERAARAKEASLNAQIEDARNAAVFRDRKITELSRTLVTTSNGLRDTISSLRRQLSADSIVTLRNKANTSLHLLGECQERYGELAEAADRHASDVVMLEESWPK